MVECKGCGAKNDDDARYCNKCGNSLAKYSVFEEDIKKLADDVGRGAEEFGRKAERFGERIEKEVKEFVKSVEQSSHSKAKYCPDCMTELDSDAKFCRKCGKKIE